MMGTCACEGHKIDCFGRLRLGCKDDAHCKPSHNGLVGGGVDWGDAELGRALADGKLLRHGLRMESGVPSHSERTVLEGEGLVHCSSMQDSRLAWEDWGCNTPQDRRSGAKMTPQDCGDGTDILVVAFAFDDMD